ncbi:MAG: tripartite tricarboxylate transporter TctB family protein [Alphaproteobacteria bacterium]|nr:tripartite tricarboxylate transporter TctB family protein [Alphaproteobacteria bacterium]
MTARGRAILGGLSLIVLAALSYWSAADLPVGSLRQPGPGFLPRVLAAALAVLAALHAWRGQVEAEPGETQQRPVILVLGLMLAWGALLTLLGFLPTTALLLIGLMRLVWQVPAARAALYGSAAALGLWLLFVKLLGVSLPAGLLA